MAEQPAWLLTSEWRASTLLLLSLADRRLGLFQRAYCNCRPSRCQGGRHTSITGDSKLHKLWDPAGNACGGRVPLQVALYRHRPVSDRDLDVVVFGATGVTGRSVAAYLAERSAEMPLRWAAAARDTSKAARILGELGVEPTETIVADVGDLSSLAAMAARARVVLNLVGPYTLYG